MSKFGIIREQGDFSEFEELSDKENEVVKEQYARREQEENDKNKKRHYRG